MKIEIEIPDEIAESIGEHAVRQAWLEHDGLCLWAFESGLLTVWDSFRTKPVVPETLLAKIEGLRELVP